MKLKEKLTTIWRPTVVYRGEPIHPPQAFDQSSTRYQVQVRTEEAPQPVKDTTFANVGRDTMHAIPTEWRYQQLAFGEWLSVMGHPFGVAKVPSALVVSMPYGQHMPLRERTNIDMPLQTALGSMTTVQGVQSSAPIYAKITL